MIKNVREYLLQHFKQLELIVAKGIPNACKQEMIL